ncbi:MULTISPECIES: hypothetical protein [Streptomyces]|uniref:Uncharacterized protein n=2 Tax=Streptomyces rimosus subsp. rimosus TaxID=132474 RepID=L8EZY7_STRR1|nr:MULTISPECIES: hypothetical protein [Streptomyces]KOG76457.1 hypothetical protein ADK78_10265 [Kitasatospora aureofaciens]MYT48287.1 hypothetical protein [Streptomyces sp. SID5471]KEF21261.1 hypothetical protein DF18_08775 [Streptomyces rimosus]KOT41207.1 hypothetical protein ADK84_12740 [Streptomyces sp. NRRL WC-3701]KOT46178.1 hypothetical protein ADK42_01645 [Streptomyces rimosus subsp. rimosus]
MELTDVVVAKVAEEYGVDVASCCDALDVELLVMAAQAAGLLEGVVVHQLVPVDAQDDSFVIAVFVGPGVAAVSFPVHVREVIPDRRTEVPSALRHALGRLQGIAGQVVADHARWSGRTEEPQENGS